MTDHEILEAIAEICAESFNPDNPVSDLHRAQALAIVWCTILSWGANLPPKEEQKDDRQMSFDDLLSNSAEWINREIRGGRQ